MFGLDGSYTYTFSDEAKTVELVNCDDNSVTKMKKLDSYSSVPTPSGKEKIDDALLGAWLDSNGEYLYFDKSGVMYRSQKGFDFTYYTYSVSNKKINMKYNFVNDYSEKADYEVNGDVLTYNGIQYKKIPLDELE